MFKQKSYTFIRYALLRIHIYTLASYPILPEGHTQRTLQSFNITNTHFPFSLFPSASCGIYTLIKVQKRNKTVGNFRQLSAKSATITATTATEAAATAATARNGRHGNRKQQRQQHCNLMRGNSGK